MANTLLTPTEIAMEALVLVQSQMVASRLMDRGYEGEIKNGKVGESIQIRRRQNGVVNEWSPGGTLTTDPIVESPITITLEKHFDASVIVGQRERQFDIRQFSSQILAPQMLAMAEQIDTYALEKVRDLPEVTLNSGPLAGLPNSVADMAQVRRRLNDLKCPMSSRFQVASPAYEEALLSATEFSKVNESGSSGALREADLGRLLGMSTFMDQNVEDSTHTTGTATTAALSADALIGATTIVTDTGAIDSGTWAAGDILTLAGYGNVVVDALVVGGSEGAGSSTATLVIREPLRSTVLDTTVVTNFDGGAGDYQSHGAAFHPRAFAFVAPALMPHEHAPESTTVIDPNTGVSLRVTFDYDRDEKADVMSIDALIGVKMVDGRLGAQVILGV